MLSDAPIEFWETAEQIPTALILDILAAIEWIANLIL